DLHLAYRQSNIEGFKRHGASYVHVLGPYFIPSQDYPLSARQRDPKFAADVVFAGHYEPDSRLKMLEAISHAGYKLRIYGAAWDRSRKRLSMGSPLQESFPIYPVIGADYQQAICGAKVALCFLSALNE